MQAPERYVSGVAAQSVAGPRNFESDDSAYVARMQLQKERDQIGSLLYRRLSAPATEVALHPPRCEK
jgi:hypothetical protein